VDGEVVRPGFRAFVARHAGEEARSWLNGLPSLEARVADRWQLQLGGKLRGGVLACVRAVTTVDGEPAVLKLAGPWDRPADEIACLRLWGGGPSPRLLEADPELGALLLERIRPGTQAGACGALDVADVLQRLQISPPPAGLPPLPDVARRRIERAREQGRANEHRVSWALQALDKLGREPRAEVLVHGDFDERNLLRCERRGLCAIDPLPAAGDPAYDAAYWVHANGRPGRRARFDAMVAALGLSRDDGSRLRDWCGIVAVHG